MLTSGGNRDKETDIQSARAVLFVHGAAQGSGLGENGVAAGRESGQQLGQRPVWIVQDLLADYTHTALPLDDLRSPDGRPAK